MSRVEETPKVLNTTKQLSELRSQLEKKLIPQSPLAYSTDGKTFGYETPLSNPLAIGSYVVLHTKDDVDYFGQIITQEISVKDGLEYGTSMDTDAGMFVAKITASAQVVDRIKIRFIQGLGILLAKLDGDLFGIIDG